ncbi:MAG: histone [Candidatus Korarchaeota archaeon]|nr:histone [Candidatus Korarchaeota archaeon]NIU82069.1 histone [Candidatus Thorarchaeota archaeon]NIW12489.1 histone [Candidatus Thorarchaeota archaeon]NIW50703.1 histone [Candidatus Korarchaeota archaeon]
MAELPRAGIRRLMESAGAKRMSQDAVITLRDLTEQFTEKLSRIATEMATHDDRKTVKKSDVHKAASIMKKGSGFF